MRPPAPEFQRLTGRVPDFKDFLLSLPDLDGLDIRRPADDVARFVELSASWQRLRVSALGYWSPRCPPTRAPYNESG